MKPIAVCVAQSGATGALVVGTSSVSSVRRIMDTSRDERSNSRCAARRRRAGTLSTQLRLHDLAGFLLQCCTVSLVGLNVVASVRTSFKEVVWSRTACFAVY